MFADKRMRLGGTFISVVLLLGTLLVLVSVVTNAAGGDTDMYYNEAKALLDSTPMVDGFVVVCWLCCLFVLCVF